MMLVEKDPEKLKESGYDNQYTPQYVTFLFLQKMLNGILLEKSQTGVVGQIRQNHGRLLCAQKDPDR